MGTYMEAITGYHSHHRHTHHMDNAPLACWCTMYVKTLSIMSSSGPWHMQVESGHLIDEMQAWRDKTASEMKWRAEIAKKPPRSSHRPSLPPFLHQHRGLWSYILRDC